MQFGGQHYVIKLNIREPLFRSTVELRGSWTSNPLLVDALLY